ncbi:hypothetical protein MCEMSE15_02508 [Fimbriimonadaceae bacterium]
MSLNTFAAEKRMSIYQALKSGQAPAEGTYDEDRLKEARAKGEPQVGATRYEPHAVVLEFIYPDSRTNATVLEVRVPTPERVVWLPVPAWVVEQIWEGEITGSFAFLSDAELMLSEFSSRLQPEANLSNFGVTAPTRRG